ncbi:unnamed protein product [Symbiodinium sp. KB8]|nr:unnamed protein product [Symbiodinium sp. KB8]
MYNLLIWLAAHQDNAESSLDSFSSVEYHALRGVGECGNVNIEYSGDFTPGDAEEGQTEARALTPWFLVGNGGMGYWDYYRAP